MLRISKRKTVCKIMQVSKKEKETIQKPNFRYL